MDVQLKKGLLDVCVLVVLKQNDSYGYQIIKDITPYISLSESTLYPILKRLESSRALITYSMAHNDRLRKYYQITEQGIERIREFLDDWKDVMKIYDIIERMGSDEQTTVLR